jgi:hypothetical protein
MQKFNCILRAPTLFTFLLLIFQSIAAQTKTWQDSNIALTGYAIPNQFGIKRAVGDSSQSIHIINASSLKQLPAVLGDLTAALNESMFQEGLLLGGNGLYIYVYDAACNSLNSACVLYQLSDTIYQLKLNRFNQQATDRALAATIIHEIMHCVLLDVCKRAKKEEEKAVSSIISFGLNKNDTSSFFNNDFFVLMNTGNDGQHELIYRLFYPQMVSLLERFAGIHKEVFLDHREAEHLIWSGLQKTSAYKKLDEDEKREIELTILEAKRIKIAQD